MSLWWQIPSALMSGALSQPGAPQTFCRFPQQETQSGSFTFVHMHSVNSSANYLASVRICTRELHNILLIYGTLSFRIRINGCAISVYQYTVWLDFHTLFVNNNINSVNKVCNFVLLKHSTFPFDNAKIFIVNAQERKFSILHKP